MKIFPKEQKFFDLFEKGAKNVVVGADLLKNLIHDYTDIVSKSSHIKEIEHEGDIITHSTIEKLNLTFITPLDREDIYSLIKSLDDILDYIDAVASRMVLYNVQVPTEEAKALVNVLVKSVNEVAKAITELKNIKKPEQILNSCIEINRLENEGDALLRESVAKLFSDNLPPLEVIKWKELYENLETAIDKCEDVANVVEGIVLKNA